MLLADNGCFPFKKKKRIRNKKISNSLGCLPEKASLEQKRGKKVSYSIVLLKSSNETSIKSNVTWIKTMHCINHFLLFHRRQSGRAYIKIQSKNLKAYAGKGGGGGWSALASLSKQMARDFFVLLHITTHFYLLS